MATVEEQTQAPVEEQKNVSGSGTGLDPKLLAVGSYFFWPIIAIIVMVSEKEDKYVRFHAAQAIVFGGALFVVFGALFVLNIGVAIALSTVPGGGLISMLVWLTMVAFGIASFIGWIMAVVKAWTDYDSGQVFKIPVVGGIAEKIAGL